jgi:hypothetical protein
MVVLTVTLDTGRSASVVRSERVPWLPFGPDGDLAWQIDQYTQETIGSVLAEEGWEPFGEDRSDSTRSEDKLAHSAVYTVRNLSTPIVTWNDLK